MPWFAYGYFVRLPDRSIVHAGHDFGPTHDSYAVGDSLGVKGDTEDIVIGILKGEPAKLSGGYDVFVLVEQRRVREQGSSPPPPWDFFQREEGRQFVETLMRGPTRLVSRPQIQATVGDQKFRAVGKKLYRRPLNESFYDFQLNHLLWLLGEDWYTALILTNFGWHFSREEGAPPGENFWARVEHPRYPIREQTLELLHRAISEYGKVVDEEERKDLA